ncbi:MAG: hypothetical protein HQM04_18310 [Magnetococcales bacterium]|nr:hypothetical protein [Magnetococcales bacterium]MBF0116982.1 hypothetical protein [Magnetococcales bacterium]
MTPLQLPPPKETELQNWPIVDKSNNMPISFKIVKSKNLLTFKPEVNRFWRIRRGGEENRHSQERAAQKSATPFKNKPTLTFGNIELFRIKKAASLDG